MFVAEIDRPWLDTPFMMQGLLLEDEEDIATLGRLCEYVYIDPLRSTLPMALPGAPQQKARPNHVVAVGDKIPVPRPKLIVPVPASGAIQRIDSRASLANARHPHGAIAPPGVTLVSYPDDVPFEKEISRARETYQRAEEIFARFSRDLELNGALQVGEIESVARDLADSVIANPDALFWVTRLRATDSQAYGQGLRSGIYLLTLGRHLGFPPAELQQLAMSGMLLDVGKIKLPRALLDKKGTLTKPEFGIVKRHVQYGLDILAGAPGMSEIVLTSIAHHHERLDGSGYPHGLRGDEISIYGRMAALVDSFSAMIAERPYANAQAPGDVLLALRESGGSQLHIPLLEQFIQAVGVFPVGSLVELSSGQVAIVVRQNRLRRLRPRLLLLTDPTKKVRDKPIELDLMEQPSDDHGTPIRIIRGLPSGAFGVDSQAFFGATADAT